MGESFDVFLSHNSRDKPAVRELAEALRARGLKVWLDEWELVPGRPWLDALERTIETIGCAAVVVGRDSLGPWEVPEMRACIAEFVGRGLPVIPVLLPGASEKLALPSFLKQFTWVDLRLGLSSTGLDRLEWGITGKKPKSHYVAIDSPPDNPQWRVFTEALTGIRFLWIPGGRFQMGGSDGSDEKPLHWVRISPFWLGETPVTNRQYAVFLEKREYREPDLWRDRRFSAPDQPVVGVSWKNAQVFCNWLSEVSGRQVRLPSEAQWEFAARSTDGREYPWGNEVPDASRARFSQDRPAPVGSYPAGQGPFGTLDLAGNVWEWCRDAWDEKAYGKRAEKGDEPIDPVVEIAQEERRVLRGGGWLNPADELRAADRGRRPAWSRYYDVGFRVAAEPVLQAVSSS